LSIVNTTNLESAVRTVMGTAATWAGRRGSLEVQAPRVEEVEAMAKKQAERGEAAASGSAPVQLGEAAELIEENASHQFNEPRAGRSFGRDPKHSDQVVRGTVGLPNGLGKTVRVLVIAAAKSSRRAGSRGRISSARRKSCKKSWRLDGYDAVCHAGHDAAPPESWVRCSARAADAQPEDRTVTFEVAKAIKEVSRQWNSVSTSRHRSLPDRQDSV